MQVSEGCQLLQTTHTHTHTRCAGAACTTVSPLTNQTQHAAVRPSRRAIISPSALTAAPHTSHQWPWILIAKLLRSTSDTKQS